MLSRLRTMKAMTLDGLGQEVGGVGGVEQEREAEPREQRWHRQRGTWAFPGEPW